MPWVMQWEQWDPQTARRADEVGDQLLGADDQQRGSGDEDEHRGHAGRPSPPRPVTGCAARL